MSTATAPKYTARDLQVLEGLEPVRKRPSMYIADPDKGRQSSLTPSMTDISVQ